MNQVKTEDEKIKELKKKLNNGSIKLSKPSITNTPKSKNIDLNLQSKMNEIPRIPRIEDKVTFNSE